MAYAIGLMSGTSLDGCDAALVEIDGGAVRQLGFVSLPMPEGLKARILDCCSPERSNVALICSVNVELGRWFAQAALDVAEAAGIPMADVEVIGSHGQTIWHIPQDDAGHVASTLQIGDPATISYRTMRPVVSNLRAMDMAAGGRGAPLVPYADYLLYRTDHPRALQNLGGIGNVTGLPANCALEDVFAFDTGPGNMIIDALADHFFGVAYDADGWLAAQGQVDVDLLAEWMSIPFVQAPPPKATGRELYGADFVQRALAAHPKIAPHDWLATATRYTAETMGVNFRLYVFPRCPAHEVILAGGGVHNGTLRRQIADALPECRVMTQEDLGFSSDAKEAIAFALLAHETVHSRPGNVPGATGAAHQVVLGDVTNVPW